MLRLVFTWIILLFLTTCNQEEELKIPGIYTGTVSALKNGERWSALARADCWSASTSSKVPDSLYFFLDADVYNNGKGPVPSSTADPLPGYAFLTESFVIRKFRLTSEKQYITSIDNQNQLALVSSYYLTVVGGDVLGDKYDLDTTATSNFIQIINYDSSKAEIEGIFNVTLSLSKDANDGKVPPEKFEFTEGRFTVKVEKDCFE
ncbi:MAG: hypothetical protein OXH57_05070 [Ekhidna sp.]|nr:hypothetical protein [Ekhidna sp.]